MGVTTTTLGTPFGAKIIIDLDADETLEAATTGGAELFQVRIDNSSNTSDVYVKMIDAATGNVTVGTTETHFVFPCPAGARINYIPYTGLVFGTAISMFCVTGIDKDSTDGPGEKVEVRLHTS